MRIGDSVFVHGYVDEIRKDTVIVKNDGGYFGTVKGEIFIANNFTKCSECVYKDECEQIVVFDIGENEVQGHRTRHCSYGRREDGEHEKIFP